MDAQQQKPTQPGQPQQPPHDPNRPKEDPTRKVPKPDEDKEHDTEKEK